MNTKTVGTPLQQLASQLHGIALTRYLHDRWVPQDTRQVEDREELRKRLLHLVSSIGDLAAYSDGRLPNAIRAAIAEKIVTLGEINRLMALHQLPEMSL